MGFHGLLQGSLRFKEKKFEKKKKLVHKSLLKIMNDRGPNVEPCGIPDSMEKGEEDFPKVRITENLNY
jgi:hypothetical protein